jgi:N-acetyl-1-D-myo-inositol-2-amino-2-deoxy-alpha-D-glucopyranoside deacetylase
MLERGREATGHKMARYRLMGIYAHPDDEAFGLAGTLARATAAGNAAAVVCATRGEEGQIADAALATRQNLAEVREGELRRACAAVGVHDVSFLDYVDGHLAEADEAEAVGRIVYHLRRFRPDVAVTFAANGGYGHVDHMAIHRLTRAAVQAAADASRYGEQLAQGLEAHRVRKVYFGAMPRERLVARIEEARRRGEGFTPGGDAATIPLEEMGVPVAEITTEVVLNDAEYAAKQRALHAHATQMPAVSWVRRATPEQARTYAGTEYFVLAPPPISDCAYAVPEDDLFAGLESFPEEASSAREESG